MGNGKKYQLPITNYPLPITHYLNVGRRLPLDCGAVSGETVGLNAGSGSGIAYLMNAHQ
ncbi:hypothetical protein MiSe_70800 [Microseira wollei NIES-4236]|uniref:Uncharacterized protein n=2 Tax=Microseira wollei TaxID=467598 RepID=A0AAV3XNA3_9CYAN|nr:hypothetical protein MiSe_70800 [Microseira wollei NIES-4236]